MLSDITCRVINELSPVTWLVASVRMSIFAVSTAVNIVLVGAQHHYEAEILTFNTQHRRGLRVSCIRIVQTYIALRANEKLR